MAAEPTTQESHLYQPLQMNQRSGDRIYQNVTKPKQSESEYELVEHPVTTVRTQQPNVYQSLKQAQIHKDEIRQELSTKETGSDDIKAAMKKMKIIILVTVTFNIVVLLLIIVLAILGGIQIQSTMTTTTSQINELSASTKEDVQDIVS